MTRDTLGGPGRGQPQRREDMRMPDPDPQYDRDATQAIRAIRPYSPPTHPAQFLPPPQQELEKVAGPAVEIIHHTANDSDGSPYRRTEVVFHDRPPQTLVLEVVRLLLSESRSFYAETDPDGTVRITNAEGGAGR